VIGVGKQLFSERFQVINVYRLDVLLNRFASILVDLFNIKVLGFHAGRLIPRPSDRPAKSSCHLEAEVLRNAYLEAARPCNTTTGEIA
jgi:hypothetical protein